MLSIRDFLLAFAAEGEPDTDSSPRSLLHVQDRGADMPARQGSLRAEIERHHERTMTVISRRGLETITRCEVCPESETTPCIGLRRLAVPYAQHPAYRPEWRP